MAAEERKSGGGIPARAPRFVRRQSSPLLSDAVLDSFAGFLDVLAEAFGGLATEAEDGKQQEGEGKDAEALDGLVHDLARGRFDRR